MVDEPIAPATPAPAVETAAPAVAPAETPAPAATTETPAPVATETPVAPAVAETPTPPENPLGDETAKPEAVKTDAPKTEAKDVSKTDTKPDGDKAAEAKPEAPVLPAYDEFKLPENFKLEKEPLDAFTKILGEIETGKLDHVAMQAKGQALIDLATKNVEATINRLNDSYVEIHKQNIQKRVEALKADPELGGQNFDKTVAALQTTIKEYGGTEAQISEFRKEITESGLGASPAVCRLIYNMQQKINKYTTETSGNMVPGQKPAPVKVKPYQAFYQGNG